MRTNIFPTLCTIPNTEIEEWGFFCGREFVPMRPHKGFVDMTYSTTGRPKFLKSGNASKEQRRHLKYRGNRVKLEMLREIPDNTIEILCQSQGNYLVVVPSYVNELEEESCLVSA